MFIEKCILPAAGASLAAIVLLAAPRLGAQTPSESERLQKLERAVEQLQKRNAELEDEVSNLKKQTALAAPPPAEGPTKTKVTWDGKTYVEKSVPVEKPAYEKWKLSNPLTELELYGDARLRYEYRGGRTPGDDPMHPNDWQERERERYRVRLGLRGTVLDDWFFGIRLETAQSPRSTNVTFGDDTSGSSSAATNGPFSKVSDGINVGQAYIGYKGFPGITLTGGKMPNPLVTTLMVWDPDINPEGLAEQWKHTFTIGGGAPATASYSKDGKTLVNPPPSAPLLKIDVFANFAQFVYDDANPENPIGPRPTTSQPVTGETQRIPNTDAFLLAWQVGAKFSFPNNFYFQLAPTVYNYSGNGDTFNIHYQGDSSMTNETGINSLLVLDVPAEIGWKVWKLPMRLFGDFAVNLEGDDRATAAGHSGKGDQRYAYNVGLGVGQLKHKGDWEIDGWWQHTEQYSLDPNLIDDDIFDARENIQGVAVKAGYMLSDAVSLNLTYSYAWRIDDALGTGGIGGAIGINPLDKYQLLQVDLNLKF